MKRYKLLDILPETLTTQFDFSASYTPPGSESPETYTIFTTSLFVQELEQHFTDRIIRLGDTTPTSDLLALFGRWKNSRSDSYARRAYALSVKYEPLENYDRIEHKEGSSDLTHGEEIERTHANTDTETHTADTITRSYTNYNEESVRSGSETNSSGIFGVNSASNDPVPANTDTTTYNDVTDSKDVSGSYSDEHTGSISNAHTGTITDVHSGIDSTEDSYDLRAHGNIGVTTAAQMLEEDRKLISYDLALVAICDFIDRYTFYSEGLDL